MLFYTYLTNKRTKYSMLTLFLTLTLLHVSMRKHHPHQKISLYTKVTKTIKDKIDCYMQMSQ